ncbi:hypothetical protein BVRB_014480 [Beta vulgaris subsp. vulgaris]|uniref:Gnk2-homologous domain-containing protein n=1 Tax=Beta vulgaris subsp. vulgaris TaxID=3555 RepID=A0A0J8DVJ4_BETVV|nr:hypothetical protein BVRB_014480 [Beta vulgaris subsp. vulgaris]
MATSSLAKIKITLLFLISSFLLINSQLTYIHQECYDRFGKYNILSNFGNNIDNAITELASRASTTYFSNYTSGIGEDQVNAFYSCRYDVPLSVCQSCVASVANNVSSCFSSVESLIVYEECTFHYSNRSIFSVMEELPRLYHYSPYDTEQGQFSVAMEGLVTLLINNVTTEFLASSRYFAMTTARFSSRESIYALAQCNPDITSFDCRTCLQSGFYNFANNHTGALPVYGQIFLQSCRLSYILTSEVLSRPWRFARTFLQDTPTRFTPGFSFPSTGTRGSSTIGAMIASIFSVALSWKLLL